MNDPEHIAELDFAESRARKLGCPEPERAAKFAIACADGRPGWVCAEIAGYSPGNYADEATRRKNLGSAASRAKRAEKISAVVTAILDRRTETSAAVLDSGEVLEMISEEARHAVGATKIQALRLLSTYHEKQSVSPTAYALPDVARELARRDDPLARTLGAVMCRAYRVDPPIDARAIAEALDEATATLFLNEIYESIERVKLNASRNPEIEMSAAEGAAALNGAAESGSTHTRGEVEADKSEVAY